MPQTPLWPIQTFGTPSQPALIFLHGFLGKGSNWHPIAREFSEEYYCILPDLPGHGANNIPDESRLLFTALSDEFLNILDAFNLRAPVLIGYSLGGRLALTFALRYPERLRALILESASPGLEDKKERDSRAIQDDRLAEKLRQVGTPEFLAGWYQSPLFASLARQPELLNRICAENQSNDASQLARVLGELSPGRMPSHWGRLSELTLPTLLLAGALDEKYQAQLTRAAEFMPTATLRICPDGGHNLHSEKPAWFVKKLREFLATLTV